MGVPCVLELVVVDLPTNRLVSALTMANLPCAGSPSRIAHIS